MNHEPVPINETYYKKNKERLKILNKEYRIKNADKIRAQQKEYRERKKLLKNEQTPDIPLEPAQGTPAPGMPAPGTPAPDTPAPGTPAPDTQAPDTPAPGTPAPGTPAPDTPAETLNIYIINNKTGITQFINFLNKHHRRDAKKNINTKIIIKDRHNKISTINHYDKNNKLIQINKIYDITDPPHRDDRNINAYNKLRKKYGSHEVVIFKKGYTAQLRRIK